MSVNLHSLSRSFRGNDLYSVFKEGVAQGFVPFFSKRTSHAYLACPQCRDRIMFSITGTGGGNGKSNKVADLRRHGFVWQGRPAEHTAPLPDKAARS